MRSTVPDKKPEQSPPAHPNADAGHLQSGCALPSPARSLLVITLSIFAMEILVTTLLTDAPHQPWLVTAAIDASLLVALLAPILYLLLFRPLARHLRKREEAELALRQSQEAQFQEMLRTSLDGFWMNDERGRFLEVNDAYCSMIGYSRSELLNMGIQDIEAVETPEATTAHLQELFSIGYVFFETRHRRKDGEILDMEISATAVNFENARVYCFIRNITARKKAETALREAEEKFHDLFENAPDMFVSVETGSGRIIECNQTLVRKTGYSKEEIIGRSILDMYHQDCHDLLRPLFLAFMETGEAHAEELQLRCKDGSTIDVSLNTSAIRNKDGAIIRSRSIWRDITARKLADADLRLQGEITANAAEGIALIRAGDATFQYTNRRFELLLGYAPGELIGKPLSVICAPAQKSSQDTVAEINGRLTEGGEYSGELLNLRKDGMPIWTHIHVSTVTHPRLGPLWIVYQTDISARKRSDEALQLAAMVYESSSEAIAVTDPDNLIIAVNPAFEKMTGYSAEEVLGKNPNFMSSGRHEQDFYRQMWLEILSKGYWQGEVWDKRKNGEIYAKALSISVIRNQDGSVHRHVALFSDITERKQSEELIWKQANFDPLTELPNRRMFLDRLQQDVRKADRSKLSVALLLIDLDQFKEVNDTLGHAAGDALLKEAAFRIRSCVRSSDTVARLGGDEFTVILPEAAELANVEDIAQKIIDRLAEYFEIGHETVYVSASIGITLYPNDAGNIEDMMKNADQAMYAAKHQGRNRFSYFTHSLQEHAQKRLRLINDLRVALPEKQLLLHFQPIIDLVSGRVSKVESLLRWQHPERGLVSPAEFIPLAEESGLIHELGDWVFRESARWVQRWRQQFDADFQVSVNKSPVQFRTDYSANWLNYLRELQVPGHHIVVEITEGMLLHADGAISDKLLAFRDAGVQVAIDDFGTGYSALSYLKRFDIDYLKIDQTFVRNLDLDSSDLALCEAIIVMAHKLGLKVIAEGVETEAQHAVLASAGCDYAQGYLFSRPLPPEQLEQFLLQYSRKG
ncbi:MAG TPA: PAS domain S-box protein [Gallionellaceae bacterium]